MTTLFSAKYRKTLLVSIFLLQGLFIHITAFAEAALIPLGSFWPGSPNGGGVALGLSDDGAIAVGWSTAQSIEDDIAFRWDENAGLESLMGINVSKAEVISGDGLTIFGILDVTHFMWTEIGGTKFIDPLILVAASYDGSIQIGSTSEGAFRRVGGATGTVSFLGSLTTDQSKQMSESLAVSSDGSVVVGWSNSDVIEGKIVGEAFRWTQSGGMLGLGLLPSETSNFVSSQSRAVSHSGDIVAGTARVFEDGKSVSHGFIWQQETGIQSFYASPEPVIYVIVEDMSADGKVIVGTLSYIGNTFLSRAFRYTETNGMQTVEEWLTEASVDLEGWNIKSAYAVSADGNIVAGYIENTPGTSRILPMSPMTLM